MTDDVLFQGYFAGTIDLHGLMSGYLNNHPGATLVVFMHALDRAQQEYGE